MKIKTLLLVPVLSVCFYASAQESPITIGQSLSGYLQEFPQEKAYLHLDKPFYAAGDTIWFKAYLTDATLHLPLSLSEVLYVDVIKEDGGELISHKLVKIDQGFSHGQIALPETLVEGLYHVRAYTNWMRNLQQEFFFRKDIRIFNTAANPAIITENEAEQLSEVKYLDFFPEGGNFVAGLQNRIAFKAVNLMGQGVKFKGHVLSDRSDTVGYVSTHHSGLGHFTMIPQKGRTYSAHIKLKNGETKKYGLPDLSGEGYLMQVDNMNTSSIRVFIRHNLVKSDSAILIAHQRGMIVYGAQAAGNKKEYMLVIPKADFPDDGVVHLTLFNRDGIPQCERLVYINKQSPHHISFTTDKPVYRPREETTIDITIKDEDGNPVQGNFSLAVTDRQQVIPELDTDNIQSYFYLTSDISSTITSEGRKETIENPTYYFNQANKNASYHLDLLLMTHGWRRFLWNDVLKADTIKPAFNVEKGITIKGQVLRLNGKAVRDSINLILMSTSKNQQGMFTTGTSGPDGKFEFGNLDLYDSATILIQASKSSGGKNLDISFSEPVLPEITAYRYPLNPLLFNRSSVENFLKTQRENEEFEQTLKLNKVQMLEAVVVEAKREESDSRRMLYGTPDATIKVDNSLCGGAMNVLQMLQGRVAGVMVAINPADPTNASVTIRGQQATFLVDGMRVTDLSFISPCDVEAIDVIRNSTVVAGASGVVSILTRRGNANYDYANEKAPGIGITSIAGYLTPREFYTPRYETPDNTTNTNDFRSTIYWNPDVVTDSSGKAKVTFRNSQSGTTVRLVLEGLTNEGKAIARSYQYDVK